MLNELPVIVELREILFNYSENPVFFICLFVIIPTIVLISIGVLVKIFSRIRDLEKQVKTKKMREISELIQEGAKVYLKDQRMMLYKLMAFLIVPVGLNGLDFLDNKILSFFLTAIIFSLGCMSSLF